MRYLVLVLLLAGLMGCAQVHCPEEERDGGVGGTGSCKGQSEDRVRLAAGAGAFGDFLVFIGGRIG